MTSTLQLGFLLFAATLAPAFLPAQTRPVVVVMETSLGTVEAEIDVVHAPVTSANFLKYVDAGSYNGGQFHRTVKPDNQPNNTVKIEVIQAAVAQTSPEQPPIALERTSVTGLRHLDGVISPSRWRHFNGTNRSGLRHHGIFHLHRRPAVARFRGRTQPRWSGFRGIWPRDQRNGRGAKDPEFTGCRAGTDATSEDPEDCPEVTQARAARTSSSALRSASGVSSSPLSMRPISSVLVFSSSSRISATVRPPRSNLPTT